MASEPSRDEVQSPRYDALVQRCAAQPDAVEDHPWGDTVFKVRGKIFAFLGPPEEPGGPPRMTVKPAPDDVDGLLQLPYISVAPYVGRYGWVRVTVVDDEALDIALDLIEDSYRIVAARGKKRKEGAR